MSCSGGVKMALEPHSTPKPDYPVMFTVRDAVVGNGFVAGVTVSGRAVMCEDDGKWWVYGVRPSPVAETGSTPEEAFLRFRNTYKNVLFDLAEDCETYETFRAAVERFYYQPDPEEEERWETAFKAIRMQQTVPEGFFSKLPQQSPETRPTQLTVERIDKESTRYKPTDNVPDFVALPKAA
jgi:predicted RNase H-like HicB family nuclease